MLYIVIRGGGALATKIKKLFTPLVVGGFSAAVLALHVFTLPVQADTVPGSNGKIAFTSNRSGTSEVYTMNPDGSDVTNLTNGDGGLDPAWSPDGKQLAFTSDRDGENEIYIMDEDGSNVTQVTSNTDNDTVPTWSPDGTKLAYIKSGTFGGEIYAINVDGTNETAITNNFVDDTTPSWSPDGTKIAYGQYVAGSQFNLFIANADGSNEVGIPNQSFTASMDPTWSPDGTKIVFQANRTGNYDIFVTDVDETVAANQVNLTNFPAASDVSPSWSPDGTKIVFQSNRTGNNDIYTMSTDGTNVVALTNDAGQDTQPVWQPAQATPTPTPVTPPSPVPASHTSTQEAETLADTGVSIANVVSLASVLLLVGAAISILKLRKIYF